MRAIQFILIPVLVTLVIIYFGRVRSGMFDRIIVLLLGVTGAVMVAMPDWTNILAHVVGVGRGADLVIYFSLMGFAFVCLMLYSKLRALESHLTVLVRAEAIEHAKMFTKVDKGNIEPNV